MIERELEAVEMRRELVGRARRYLREHPGEDSATAELACTIVEHGGRITGAPIAEGLRQRIRQIQGVQPEYPRPPEVEAELKGILEEWSHMNATADAHVDAALEQLAKLRAEELIDT